MFEFMKNIENSHRQTSKPIAVRHVIIVNDEYIEISFTSTSLMVWNVFKYFLLTKCPGLSIIICVFIKIIYIFPGHDGWLTITDISSPIGPLKQGSIDIISSIILKKTQIRKCCKSTNNIIHQF